jgi:hypothetical protein
MASDVLRQVLFEEVSGDGGSSIVDVSLECHRGRVVVRVRLFGIVPLKVLESLLKASVQSLKSYRLADVALEVPDFLDLVMVFDEGGPQ